MSDEPRLTAEDRRLWDDWRRTCLAWSRGAAHRRAVDNARRAIEQMAAGNSSAYVAWSAGKDSTALAHVVRDTLGEARAMSVKDDIDFPGEDDYLLEHSDRWGVALDIVRPGFSLLDWLREHEPELDEDLRSRASEFSRAAFYDIIERYSSAAGRPGVYLGLRQEESAGRRRNVTSRGIRYTKRNSETVCQPLARWRDMDVYGYLFAHEIDPLHVYRCVRLHESPGKVRKSWWLPGAHARRGAGVWLKTYYPSLWRRLAAIDPRVTRSA